MALDVIGAGFGRTGTESMKQALEHLGFRRCHHMHEVLADEAQIAAWRAIAAGGPPDWPRVFEGFRAAVDWPSAFFWRDLAAAYPQAKVILTVRSAESWYRSFSSTILAYLKRARETGDVDSVGYRLIADRVFGGRAGDPEHAMAVFERNTRAVIEAIPPERLLVYTLGEGWEPLCRFLGCEVPAEPYPRSNATAEFRSRHLSAGAEAGPSG
ncbi:MAG: sulfotransferase [Thermohalobaculum sp.]|nr:sulfotransferase [Thermohalobaculum sp.]